MKAKKLPSGNYRVQVVAGYDDNGKRIVKSFTAAEEWEVLKMASDFVNKRDVFVNNKKLTVAEAMSSYIESRRNIIEKTTVRGYNHVLKHRFKGLMDMKIADLKQIHIQQAINKEAEQVSPKTIKNAYGLLKSVLKMYEININLNNIKLPKLIKYEKELPSFETVFNIVKGTKMELPCLLSAWLSLRLGEVTGLQFQDVDMESHILKIRRTIIQTEDGYEVREGCKTEKSKRNLYIPDYLFQMITAIPHNDETDFIVTLTCRAIYSRFKRLMRKNGYNITYHDLRHLNASVMLMLGVPDKYAMERGGWSTDYILKSNYQQTFTEERKKIDKLIDVYFNDIINANGVAT